MTLQTALFVASAVVQGAAFLRWNFRLSSEEIQNTLNLSLQRGGRWIFHVSDTVFCHLTRLLVSGCSMSSALLPPTACSSSALSLGARNVASDSEASDASAPTTPTKALRRGSWGGAARVAAGQVA